MSCSRIFSLVLLAYVLAVGVGIEALNSAWGNILPEWHQDAWTMDGSGYGKMRGHEREFQTILLLFGTWVYPFSVAAAYLFVHQALTAKEKWVKTCLLMYTVLCLSVLGRFLWLGVFSAGMGG